jgi:hypothetical protein
MRNPSAVLKKFGCVLENHGIIDPEWGLAGTMPCGLSGSAAFVSGARAKTQALASSIHHLLVFVLMNPAATE